VGAPLIRTYPGAEKYGPYASWQTASTPNTRFIAALVPGTTTDMPAHGVALASTGSLPVIGMAVEGIFGVEAMGSHTGVGATGTVTLKATNATIERIPSLISDGTIFGVGLYPNGSLRRAYLQDGTKISIDATEILRAAAKSSVQISVDVGTRGC